MSLVLWYFRTYQIIFCIPMHFWHRHQNPFTTKIRYRFLFSYSCIHLFIIISYSVMCMSGHFYYTRFFLNSPFSVLCSKNFEVMKLAGTRYGETNVDIHQFLILNMENPNFWHDIFLCDNNNSLYKLSYGRDNSLYKLLLCK